MHYERVGQDSLAGAKIQLHTDNSYMQPSPPHATHPSPPCRSLTQACESQRFCPIDFNVLAA